MKSQGPYDAVNGHRTHDLAEAFSAKVYQLRKVQTFSGSDGWCDWAGPRSSKPDPQSLVFLNALISHIPRHPIAFCAKPYQTKMAES